MERISPAVDAIAGPFAIEHTLIESYESQQRLDNHFLEIISEIEKEFAFLATAVRVIVRQPEFPRKFDRLEAKTELRRWITESIGSICGGEAHSTCIEGYQFTMRPHESMPHGLWFARATPHDMSSNLSHFDGKMRKLSQEKERGRTTILLIQSNDLALMNDQLAFERVSKFMDSTLEQIPDQVWFIHWLNSDLADLTDFSCSLRARRYPPRAVSYGWSEVQRSARTESTTPSPH